MKTRVNREPGGALPGKIPYCNSFTVFSKRKLQQSLLLLLCILTGTGSLFAQNHVFTVRGLIENARHQAVEGADVMLKYGSLRKTMHAVTDASGVFTFSNVTGAAPCTFDISHVGYAPQSITKDYSHAAKEESLYIALKDRDQNLEEVIVSYGRQQKRNITGSVVQLDAASMQDMPVGQFAQQLQGKAAGVEIMQNSGQPGRGMDFRIRGAASLHQATHPCL
ncbi:carboxypeptidase-like regulatory domain-containing protein [Deminuibacter soli]|uniref:TonB-dependent receptor plug domain-containing protein n=1 Tax=Deminuibacter soli TaxID=2291815 RepID=A0A3E1NF89_9BACT|nr:carboxypeptidase-like regulatory domain-containing protein [Deminuibacter soli]RFM26629.1 hypothetical protein DXN05_18835 [Deminuibacter soli]